LQAQKGQDN